MRKKGRQAPWQPLRECQADMPPWTHVAHHRQPAEAFDEKIFEGVVIRNRFDGVRQQLDFITPLRDVPANQQVVCWTILDGLVASERFQTGPRRDNGLTKSELDTIELPRDKNPGEKVAEHADRLKMLRESSVFQGNVKARHAANLRIA